MRNENLSAGFAVLLALTAAAALGRGTYAAAQSETVLHSFGGGKDANQVNGGLVFDAAGNIYGTATGGGSYNNGAVFELSPQPDGSWTETIAYSFGGRPNDGILPNIGMTSDTKGRFYGTTTMGGTYGYGAVYELSENASGAWIETTLHSFNPNAGDGYDNNVLPTLDASGNLFCTTFQGGTYNVGIAYELTPMKSGEWTETILHNFAGNGSGYYPGALILGAAGNLYGAAGGGGKGGGLIFELSPTTAGWTMRILYTFTARSENGYFGGDLILDASGNLYGAAEAGPHQHAAIFKLTKTVAGEWNESLLYRFGNDGTDGFDISGLIRDAAGNFYGTTGQGGSAGGGTAFEVTPADGEGWTEKGLHNFGNIFHDGSDPWGNLLMDASGIFYGTTANGGIFGGGTVFQIMP